MSRQAKKAVPRLLANFAAVVGCLLLAALIGVITGLAGRQLYVIGLWELAGAWMLSFLGVAWCHFLGIRERPVLIAAAVVAALAWLGGFHAADAWSFRMEQTSLVAQRGLLLADQAVLMGTDDPAELVDLSLMGETGAMGMAGAARLLLQRGLTVSRALGVSRIVALPVWLHAFFYGLQAALVLVIAGRAFTSLASEPVCKRCGAWLQRKSLGYLEEMVAQHAREAWQFGDRVEPTTLKKPSAATDVLLMADSCPHGCSAKHGLSLSRRRRIGLSLSRPGVVALLAPVLQADGSAGDAASVG